MDNNYEKRYLSTCLAAINRTVTFAIICASVMLSGCATSAVVKEANGQIKTIDKLAVLKITDAYKDNARDTVLICMVVRDLESNTESEMTLNVPLQEHNRFNVHPSLSESEEQAYSGQLSATFTGSYVEFQPRTKDLTPNCQKQGLRLPVFNIGAVISPYGSNAGNQRSSFRLPIGVSEAVYTIQQGGLLSDFGYLSTNTIVSNAYSIDISADSMLDMRTMKNQKPYLYLLTPVTVVMDTVTITVEVVVASLLARAYVGIWGITIGTE